MEDVPEVRYPAIERALDLLRAKLRPAVDTDLAHDRQSEHQESSLTTIIQMEEVKHIQFNPYLEDQYLMKNELRAKRQFIVDLAKARCSTIYRQQQRKSIAPRSPKAYSTSQLLKVSFLLWLKYVDDISEVRTMCRKRHQQ